MFHSEDCVIGHDGARSLAQVLGQCTSLSKLKLNGNSFNSYCYYDTAMVETVSMIRASIPDTLAVDL